MDILSIVQELQLIVFKGLQLVVFKELQLIVSKEFPQLLLQGCMEIESQWFLDQRVALLRSCLQF